MITLPLISFIAASLALCALVLSGWLRHQPAGNTRLGLSVAVPIAASLLYVMLGSPASLQVDTSPAAVTAQGEAEIQRMLQRLEQKLVAEPDNAAGWALLARSYKAMDRGDDALVIYQRLLQKPGRDAQVLADYADLLATRAGGDLRGEPRRLAEEASRLDPDLLMARMLAGSASFQQQDYARAIVHWQHALSLLPPDAPDVAALTREIAHARERLAADRSR